MQLDLSKATSHVVIHMYSQKAADTLGRIALARIFLEDGSFLSLVYQKFPDDTFHWRTPFMVLQQNGHVDNFPTLGGPLLEQAEAIVKRAQARIRQKFPTIPFGVSFKVTRNGAELIPNPDTPEPMGN